MKNKKAISAVVATVLIILITVAFVTIIWALISPWINEEIDKNNTREIICINPLKEGCHQGCWFALKEYGLVENYENLHPSVVKVVEPCEIRCDDTYENEETCKEVEVKQW